jgi:hypothetical protein
MFLTVDVLGLKVDALKVDVLEVVHMGRAGISQTQFIHLAIKAKQSSEHRKPTRLYEMPVLRKNLVKPVNLRS